MTKRNNTALDEMNQIEMIVEQMKKQGLTAETVQALIPIWVQNYDYVRTQLGLIRDIESTLDASLDTLSGISALNRHIHEFSDWTTRINIAMYQLSELKSSNEIH